MDKHVFYYKPDRWGHIKSPIDIVKERCYEIEFHKIEDEWDYDDLLERCAEDYHSNHDGWDDDSWHNNDLKFYLFDSTMKFLGAFNVYLEFNPSFYVTRAK